jgi:hypothetical protein
MKKFLLSAAAAVAFAGTPAAFAQASNFDEYQANQAARAAQSGAYGNSGWTPDMAYGDNHNVYPYRYRHFEQAVPVYRDRDRRDRLATRRDRDGDGVLNRDDRYPDNPRRW